VVDADDNIDLVPTPGRITRCEFPTGDDLEVISSVATGKTISPFYDSLIAQVICYGNDRGDTVAKLLSVLDATDIRGVCTNIPLLKKILRDEVFTGGEYDTGFLPAFLARVDKEELVREMEYTGVEKETSDLADLVIEGTDEIKVLAPMTGIFYITPSPSEPEYVSPGDIVDTSQTLCQIEAMKIFTQVSLASINARGNAYQLDSKYEIVRINLGAGAQVNEGDLMFVIKPA
jgi:acetyl/propionyl-CoA carboxylase alpha subunit